MRFRRIFLILILLAGATTISLALYCYAEARRMPVAHEASIGLADWPKGAKPITVALLGDIHIGSAVMDGRQLIRVVDHVNALKPDLVLIAGDFVYGHDPAMGPRVADDLAAGLARLKAPLGIVAVLGNHDWWGGREAVRDAIARAGITLLENDATQRGPIAIAGIDDHVTGRNDIHRAWARVQNLPGAKVALSHSPDVDYELPPEARLLLAGHSHCGQVQMPFYGPVYWVTRDRDRCGIIQEGKLKIVVTGGLGTSGAPFRLAAPPDLWLLHLGPAH